MFAVGIYKGVICMIRKKLSLLLALIIVLVPALNSAPVSAAVNPTATLTDVTGLSPGLRGECKIRVSMSGVDEVLSAIQLCLNYDSATMEYRSIEWGDFSDTSTKIAPTDNNGTLMFSVNDYDDGIRATDDMTVCVLTFAAAEPSGNDRVNVSLNNLEDSFVMTEAHRGGGAIGDVVEFTNAASVEGVARTEGESGLAAKISLVFDGVDGFATSGDSSGINIELVNNASGAKSSWRLDKSADRDTSKTVPTYVFNAEGLVAGNYTISVSGEGYVPFAREISMTDSTSFEITNDAFVPGDINADEKVDAADYNLIMSYIKNGRIAYTTNSFDFNRDGRVDRYDLAAMKRVLEKEAE